VTVTEVRIVDSNSPLSSDFLTAGTYPYGAAGGQVTMGQPVTIEIDCETSSSYNSGDDLQFGFDFSFFKVVNTPFADGIDGAAFYLFVPAALVSTSYSGSMAFRVDGRSKYPTDEVTLSITATSPKIEFTLSFDTYVSSDVDGWISELEDGISNASRLIRTSIRSIGDDNTVSSAYNQIEQFGAYVAIQENSDPADEDTFFAPIAAKYYNQNHNNAAPDYSLSNFDFGDGLVPGSNTIDVQIDAGSAGAPTDSTILLARVDEVDNEEYFGDSYEIKTATATPSLVQGTLYKSSFTVTGLVEGESYVAIAVFYGSSELQSFKSGVQFASVRNADPCIPEIVSDITDYNNTDTTDCALVAPLDRVNLALTLDATAANAVDSTVYNLCLVNNGLSGTLRGHLQRVEASVTIDGRPDIAAEVYTWYRVSTDVWQLPRGGAWTDTSNNVQGFDLTIRTPREAADDLMLITWSFTLEYASFSNTIVYYQKLEVRDFEDNMGVPTVTDWDLYDSSGNKITGAVACDANNWELRGVKGNTDNDNAAIYIRAFDEESESYTGNLTQLQQAAEFTVPATWTGANITVDMDFVGVLNVVPTSFDNLEVALITRKV